MKVTRPPLHSLVWLAPLVAVAGCTTDMKEGHPLGWGLMLLCVVLGLLVTLSPVKRERTIKKPKDD